MINDELNSAATDMAIMAYQTQKEDWGDAEFEIAIKIIHLLGRTVQMLTTDVDKPYSKNVLAYNNEDLTVNLTHTDRITIISDTIWIELRFTDRRSSPSVPTGYVTFR